VERYPVIHNHVKSGYSKKKVPEKFGMQMWKRNWRTFQVNVLYTCNSIQTTEFAFLQRYACLNTKYNISSKVVKITCCSHYKLPRSHTSSAKEGLHQSSGYEKLAYLTVACLHQQVCQNVIDRKYLELWWHQHLNYFPVQMVRLFSLLLFWQRCGEYIYTWKCHSYFSHCSWLLHPET
jgi:hypothetical protein